MKRFVPWIVLIVIAGWIGANWIPAKIAKDDVDLTKFGKFPVLVGGRVKPLDTVARNSLLIIHGKQELRLDNGRTLSAIEWLADVLFNASVADQYPVFLIQNDEVLGLFGWEQSQRKYFSFAEFAPFLKQIEEQGDQADKLEGVQRSAYQSAILNLRNGLTLYQRLKNSIQFEGTREFASELQFFIKNVPAAAKAAHQHQSGEQFDDEKLNEVVELIQKYEKLSEMAYILAVPPVDSEDWHSIGETLLHSIATSQIHRIAAEYAMIGDSYRARDHARFNQHVDLATNWFAKEQPNATKRTSFEFLFNRSQPFSQAMAIYVLAFLLACASWLGWSRTLSRSAFYLLLLMIMILLMILRETGAVRPGLGS